METCHVLYSIHPVHNHIWFLPDHLYIDDSDHTIININYWDTRSAKKARRCVRRLRERRKKIEKESSSCRSSHDYYLT